MSNYNVSMGRTGSAAASVGHVSAPGTNMRRLEVYDVMFGSEGTPADNAFRWQLARTTAAGTSTSVTPQALDPADGACISVAGENHSVEPTYTANALLLDIALNQRATFRWVAKDGCGLMVPATANNGIGVKTPTASAVAIRATIHFMER